MSKRIAVLALASLPLAAIAATDSYTFDPLHTSVSLSIAPRRPGPSSSSSRRRRLTPTTTTKATARVLATNTCVPPISSMSPNFPG